MTNFFTPSNSGDWTIKPSSSTITHAALVPRKVYLTFDEIDMLRSVSDDNPAVAEILNKFAEFIQVSVEF